MLLASAFLHALWNALSKKSEAPQVQIMGILIAAAMFSSLFSLFITYIEVPYFLAPAFPNRAALYWGLASGISEAGYFITFALALSRAPVGVAYIIMRGGAMLLVYTFSVLFFHEQFTTLTLVGVLVALTGLFLSSQQKSTGVKENPKLFWSYMCAIFITGYHLCYSRALSYGANPSWLFSLSLGLAVPALIIFNGKNKFKELCTQLKRTPVIIVLGGLICTTSFLLYLIGLGQSGAGYALIVRNLSIIFAQIFAFMIGEKITSRQWLGSILVALGASLVGLNK
jgi:drug/metabolite transporter (DMT)-like permease